METEQKPLRILWFMLHSGYLRYFGPVVSLLADRGHEVHLAFSRVEKDEGDASLARDLAAAHPRITFGEAPLRSRGDGWRPLAGLVRGLTDLGRYVHPRYADSPALRRRMGTRLTEHLKTAKGIDPVSTRLTLRLVRFMDSHSSERLSRRIVGSLGAVERAIPTCRRIDSFLRQRRPDAVLVSPLIEFASSQVEYVKSARALRIPVAASIASWDNLTGKGLIRVIPDRVFVWNETQVREAVEMHGVPEGSVVATGSPKFDEWFERRPSSSREEFAAQVGLHPASPFVLYACSSGFIAPDEAAFVRTWLEALRADERLREVGVLVRPHPQNAAQWKGVDLSAAGNATVWPPLGAQPDAGEARAGFFDSLAHSAAVVGINTSVLIEAAIAGRSVLVPLTDRYAGTQGGTLHFRYLLHENGGPLQVGATMPEHLDQLADALEHGDAHTEQTRRFVESFVRPRGLEQPAAPFLADAVEELAALSPAPSGWSAAPLLRVVLLPAAVAAAVVGWAASRLRRGAAPEPA